MTFEQWLESDATKDFRGLLAFDSKAKELARAAWLASSASVEHTLAPDVAVCPECSGRDGYHKTGCKLWLWEPRPAGKA